MFCKKCGAKVDKGMAFCGECGTDLKKQELIEYLERCVDLEKHMLTGRLVSIPSVSRDS